MAGMPRMTEESAPAIVHVTYRGDPTTRFDREYYVGRHLPLVRQSWQAHGLISAEVFFPAVLQPGTIAICECVFASDAAISAAFAASETPAVMADIAQFTDVSPTRTRAIAL